MIEISITSVELERVYNQMQKSNEKSFAVCSAEAREGVSSMTLVLAKRAAADGKKTLLVDFNIVHPELTEFFNAKFTDYEDLATSISKNVVTTNITNLSLLPAP